MLSTKDFECSVLFEEDGANRNSLKQPETVALKRRADKQETEDFYLNVMFLIHSNQLTKLNNLAIFILN